MFDRDYTYIKPIVKYATVFLHIYHAAKTQPMEDYYELKYASESLSSIKSAADAGNITATTTLEKNSNSREIADSIWRGNLKRRLSYIRQASFRSNLNQGIEYFHPRPSERRKAQRKSSSKTNPCKQRHPLKHVRSFGSLAKRLHLISLLLNLLLAVKYTILCLIDWDYLAEYRYLSCLIFGRTLLDARSASLAKYVTLFLAIINLGWRLQMYITKERYSFDVFEFVMTDLDEIILDEFNESDQVHTSIQLLSHDGQYSSTMVTSKIVALDKTDLNPTNLKGCRRPTRTPEAWLYLTRNLFRYTILIISVCTAAGLLSASGHLQIYSTVRGFELVHENCVSWTVAVLKRRESQIGEGNVTKSDWLEEFILENIYRPRSSSYRIVEEMRQFYLPFEDFLTLNRYHAMDTFIHIVETLLILSEVFSVLFGGLVIMLIYVREISFYTSYIRMALIRLNGLLVTLNEQKQFYSDLVDLDCIEIDMKVLHRRISNAASNIDSDELNLVSQRLQMIILDMIKVIRANNLYIRDITVRYLTLWLGFSALGTYWMFRPGDFFRTSKLECYIVHSVATIYCCIFFGMIAKVKIESAKLYQLIASNMAIDNVNLASKLRWMSVMNFYEPVPLNCFRITLKTQISLAFALKVVAWLFSALFVASTFYKSYNQ